MSVILNNSVVICPSVCLCIYLSIYVDMFITANGFSSQATGCSLVRSQTVGVHNIFPAHSVGVTNVSSHYNLCPTVKIKKTLAYKLRSSNSSQNDLRLSDFERIVLSIQTVVLLGACTTLEFHLEPRQNVLCILWETSHFYHSNGANK